MQRGRNFGENRQVPEIEIALRRDEQRAWHRARLPPRYMSRENIRILEVLLCRLLLPVAYVTAELGPDSVSGRIASELHRCFWPISDCLE
jgi:hypothetical protein